MINVIVRDVHFNFDMLSCTPPREYPSLPLPSSYINSPPRAEHLIYALEANLMKHPIKVDVSSNRFYSHRTQALS